MLGHFGAQKHLANITPEDANVYFLWMTYNSSTPFVQETWLQRNCY